MKNIIKWVIIGVVFLALAATVAILAVRLNNQSTTKTIDVTAFEIGGLNDEGEYIEDDSTIVTKNFISADGLTIEVKKDAKVEYRIAFYDKYEKLVGEMTENSSEDYTASGLDKSIVYAKVVIEPTNDAEITKSEVAKYAGQLTITVNK